MASVIDEGYEDFANRWNPILDVFDGEGVKFAHEVHPSEIAYDYWTSVRTLEAIGYIRSLLWKQPTASFDAASATNSSYLRIRYQRSPECSG